MFDAFFFFCCCFAKAHVYKDAGHNVFAMFCFPLFFHNNNIRKGVHVNLKKEKQLQLQKLKKKNEKVLHKKCTDEKCAVISVTIFNTRRLKSRIKKKNNNS